METIALTFDVEPSVYTAVTDSTIVHTVPPVHAKGRHADGNVVISDIMAGVTHQFPRGRRGSRNGNDRLDLDAADLFGRFSSGTHGRIDERVSQEPSGRVAHGE